MLLQSHINTMKVVYLLQGKHLLVVRTKYTALSIKKMNLLHGTMPTWINLPEVLLGFNFLKATKLIHLIKEASFEYPLSDKYFGFRSICLHSGPCECATVQQFCGMRKLLGTQRISKNCAD